MIGQSLDLSATAVDVVAADFAEENLPLMEEGLSLGAVCRADKIVDEPDTFLCALALRAKIICEIFWCEGKPTSTQRDNGQEQALDCMRRDRAEGLQSRV